MAGSVPSGRSWHRGLDRAAVAAAALRILDEEGAAAMTMRRIATSLDVEAASLYGHVESKDDLVDAVLDRVLDEVELPERTDDARADLIASFGAYRRALIAHPAAGPMLTRRANRSPAQVRLIVRAMELLEAGGLSERGRVDAQVTLAAYVLGFVLQEVGRSTATPTRVADRSPVLRRALDTLAERDVDQRFEVGLGIILDGLGIRRRRPVR